MSPQKKPIDFDGSGFIFRAYYGIRAPMSAKDGTPTNDYIFVAAPHAQYEIKQRRRTLSPVFDPPGPRSFRVDIYSEFKANRSAPPDDLASTSFSMPRSG